MNSEFNNRRQQVLAKMKPQSVAVVFAASEQTRSRDTEYHFRQNSYFYYLTGFNEPDACLLLSNKDDMPSSVLFCRDKNKQAEIWHGRRLGPQAAVSALDIEQAFSIDTIEAQLPELIDGHTNLYRILNTATEHQNTIHKALDVLNSAPKKGYLPPHCMMELTAMLDGMRLVKSDVEIELMQKAADISVDAHIRAMKFTGVGSYEYQVEAEIQHEFATRGARFAAYNSIVGGGDNACILHYTDNRDSLNDNELLLIDAGCEYQGYAADITRTFPVNGVFSEPQKALYQIVLEAQQAAIEAVKPGSTFAKANQAAEQVLTQGLIELGILAGNLADNLAKNSCKQYFLHGIGHWLGLDVHDVGPYKEGKGDKPFEPGMVLTIEPGIYIDQDADVDEKWKGTGIRIEDNILVTETGNKNLTQKAPKTVEAIELLMNSTKG